MTHTRAVRDDAKGLKSLDDAQTRDESSAGVLRALLFRNRSQTREKPP